MTSFNINLTMHIAKVNDWTSIIDSQRCFGNIKLKPMQNAIINCSLKHDVLVNLPTGFGKSLLFQYPASLLKDKCIIVFVPLKALLWDCLKQALLHNLTASELQNQFIKNYQVNKNLPQLLFLTPEQFFQNNLVLSFVDMLYCNKLINLIVIDEAHCISEWGSDFRPDYFRLNEIRVMFPSVRLIGMSATIPPQAIKDLIEKLKIQGCYYFQSSSNRANLIYEVQETNKSKLALKIVQYINQKQLTEQSGIIYCQTIKSAEKIYEQLKNLKINCCLFHSKLSQKVRSSNFDSFMKEQVKVIVATICFGMGVNKKNIRYVINVGVSMSAQNYYQESGRAGRDGAISFCLLLTFNGDTNSLQFLITQSTQKQVFLKRKLYKLHQIKTYAKVYECRKRALFKLLGQDFSVQSCNTTCDFCRDGDKNLFASQQVDYTDKIMQIIENLQNSRASLAKTQLINVLKGKQGVKDKLQNQKLKPIYGLLKKQKADIFQILISTLKQLSILVPHMVTFKGAFQRVVEYLKPCTRLQLKRHPKIVLKIQQKRKAQSELVAADKEHIVKDYSKFNKYLSNKNINKCPSFGSEGSHLNKSKSIDSAKHESNFKNRNKSIDSAEIVANKTGKENNIISEDDQLKQIKMISMEVDYQHIFQQLFKKEQPERQTIVIDEQQMNELKEDQYIIIDDIEKSKLQDELETQMEGNYIQQRKASQKTEQKCKQKGQNQKNESEDDQIDEIILNIRKAKEDIQKKKEKEKLAIKRKAIAQYQFL